METVNVLDFLHRDSYQKKITCKITTVGCVWPDVPCHSQTYLGLSGGDFVWSGGCIATLKNSSG